MSSGLSLLAQHRRYTNAKTESFALRFHFTNVKYEALDVCWSEMTSQLSERDNFKRVAPLLHFFRCIVTATTRVKCKRSELLKKGFHWMQWIPAYLNLADFERMEVQIEANCELPLAWRVSKLRPGLKPRLFSLQPTEAGGFSPVRWRPSCHGREERVVTPRLNTATAEQFVFSCKHKTAVKDVTVPTEFAQPDTLKSRLTSFKHQPNSSWPDIGCPCTNSWLWLKQNILNLSKYTLFDITAPLKFGGYHRRRGLKWFVLVVFTTAAVHFVCITWFMFEGSAASCRLVISSFYMDGRQRQPIREWAADWRGCPARRKWIWLKATGFLFKACVLGHFTVWDANSKS